MMTVPKLLLREIAASFHAPRRNRDLSGFDAINQEKFQIALLPNIPD
jgi:hypothetical protein